MAAGTRQGSKSPRTCSASEVSQDRDQPITHEGLQEPLTKSRNRQDGNLCGNRLGWYAFSEFLTNNDPPRPLLWPIKRLRASMLSSRTSELAQLGHATAEGLEASESHSTVQGAIMASLDPENATICAHGCCQATLRQLARLSSVTFLILDLLLSSAASLFPSSWVTRPPPPRFSFRPELGRCLSSSRGVLYSFVSSKKS